MSQKPGIFFDTSVVINLSRSARSSSPLPVTFWKALSHTFRYNISPFTVWELVSGLAAAQRALFLKNREPIRILYPAIREHFFTGIARVHAE